MIDVFPAEQQDQVRTMIAVSLQGVVTQTLVPTADGQGRVAALEILLPDDAVRNLIRQAKVEQIYSFMQTGTKRGMQTMEQSLADLTLRRVIDPEEAFMRSSRPDQLAGILQRAGMNVSFSVEQIASGPGPGPAQPQQPAMGGLRPPGQ
jgi:twitching motility protein PilT